MVANEEEEDDDKIDYNPSLYDLYTLRYSRQKKWYRPFSDDKENTPIINTIVEYHRRKIVRKQLIRQGNFKWVMILLVYNHFVVLFYWVWIILLYIINE